MPTVIIPPTDVSPNTGTGSEVLSNAPTLVNPIITGTIDVSGNITAADLILGSSGPSVKSSLSARAPRQGLVFDGTAGATHSNITLGSGDFTVAVWARVPTTSAANRQLLGSSGGDTALFLDTTGLAKIYISGQTTHTASSVVPDQKSVLIVYTRSGTSGTFYQNAVSNGTVTDSNNYSTAWSYFGSRSGGGYTTGTLIPLIYNRALSASEVVALYEAGAPAGADYNSATNTSLITGDNSTFASDTGYWTLAAGATISGGNLNLAGNGSRADRTLPLSVGKKYRAVAVVTVNTATDLILGSSTGGSYAILSGTGTLTGEFVASSTSFTIYQNGAGAITVDSITLVPIGLLLAPDAAQAGGGLTWYDTSGNAANISWTSGVSWNVPTSGILNLSKYLSVAGQASTINNSTLVVDFNTSGDYGRLLAKNSGGAYTTAIQVVNPLTLQSNLNVTGIGTFNKSLDSITTESDYAIRIKTSAEDGGLYLGANSTISAIQAIDPGTTFGRNLAIQSQGGNVLIGTTSSSGAKLHVDGSISSTGNIIIGGTGNLHPAVSKYTSVNTASTSDFPAFALSVADGVKNIRGSMYIDASTIDERWIWDLTYSSASTLAYQWKFAGTTAATIRIGGEATFAGQVNSGTSTSSGYNNNYNVQLEGASGRLIVNKDSASSSGTIYAGFGRNGSGLGSITQDGTSGVLYNTTSDARLKENVRDVTNSGAIIDALKPRVFDWKNDGDKDRFGFLAQEVHAVFPQAVKMGDDGEEVTDAWAMDAAKLVPVLVAELKTLRARVAALEAARK